MEGYEFVTAAQEVSEELVSDGVGEFLDEKVGLVKDALEEGKLAEESESLKTCCIDFVVAV